MLMTNQDLRNLISMDGNIHDIIRVIVLSWWNGTKENANNCYFTATNIQRYIVNVTNELIRQSLVPKKDVTYFTVKEVSSAISKLKGELKKAGFYELFHNSGSFIHREAVLFINEKCGSLSYQQLTKSILNYQKTSQAAQVLFFNKKTYRPKKKEEPKQSKPEQKNFDIYIIVKDLLKRVEQLEKESVTSHKKHGKHFVTFKEVDEKLMKIKEFCDYALKLGERVSVLEKTEEKSQIITNEKSNSDIETIALEVFEIKDIIKLISEAVNEIKTSISN